MHNSVIFFNADGREENAILKHCPFCGSKDVVLTVIPAHKHIFATFMPDYEGSATVECQHCEAAIIGPGASEAIVAWNRRDGL